MLNNQNIIYGLPATTPVEFLKNEGWQSWVEEKQSMNMEMEIFPDCPQ